MKTIAKFYAIAFVFSILTSVSNAQTCNRIYLKKGGTVYSAGPANLTARSATNEVKISFMKTGGRAEAEVNIYLNDQLLPSKTIHLNNGNWDDNGVFRVITLTGATGKMVKVKVINKSVTQTINYTCQIEGQSPDLVDRIESSNSGKTLRHDQDKTAYVLKSCTRKTRITISRIAGDAIPSIRVYEGSSIGTFGRWSIVYDNERWFGGNDNEITFVVESQLFLKINVWNTAAARTIECRIKAVVEDY